MCFSCGSRGRTLFRAVRDRLYSVPGSWDVDRCPRCGMLWLNPMPLEEETPLLYPRDYYTHESKKDPPKRTEFTRLRDATTKAYIDLRYGRGRSPLGLVLYLYPPRRAEADAFAMHLRAVPGGRLLDVGCGDGELLRRMATMGWDVEGIDLDPQAVEVARRRGARVRLGRLEEQDLPEDSYDAMTLNHVIEHVNDPKSLLAHCWRLLRPGGTLVALTPNGDSLGRRRFGSDWFPLETPRHLYVFTRRSLARVALGAGMAEPLVRSTIRYANYFFLLSWRVQATGRADGMRTDASRLRRVWARGWQLAEMMIPGSGEELVLRVTKNRDRD